MLDKPKGQGLCHLGATENYIGNEHKTIDRKHGAKHTERSNSD